MNAIFEFFLTQCWQGNEKKKSEFHGDIKLSHFPNKIPTNKMRKENKNLRDKST